MNYESIAMKRSKTHKRVCSIGAMHAVKRLAGIQNWPDVQPATIFSCVWNIGSSQTVCTTSTTGRSLFVAAIQDTPQGRDLGTRLEVILFYKMLGMSSWKKNGEKKAGF
eukprot:5712192-Amphidinium_carterae.1